MSGGGAKMNVIVETERLVLRQPTVDDGQAYVDFFMSDRCKYIEGPMNERDAWRAFYTEAGHWDLRGFGMFAVTVRGSDEAVGMVGPWFPHTWPEPELGWIVYEGAEGKSIAFEAAHAARYFAYTDLGWKGAVSFIDRKNTRSIRLAERLGARRDRRAKGPDAGDLVYRHPGPEEL